MPRHHTILARDIGETLGLPTYLALILLIGVPVLVVSSTIVLLYYYIKSRRNKRERNRSLSKSSQLTASTAPDPEMGVVERNVLRHPESAYQPPQPRNNWDYSRQQPPPTENRSHEDALFGTDPGEHRPAPRSKELEFPAPPDTIPRPRTAPNQDRNLLRHQGDYNRNLPANYRPTPTPPLSGRSPSAASDSIYTAPRSTHRRSRSLNKLVRAPRPTHSPSGSVRSLSIFPPRHVAHSAQSPTPSQGLTSPGPMTPSPPLLSPLGTPHSPTSYTDPGHRRHRRHPSIERNSNMPIAPIIIPTDPIFDNHSVLPVVEERNSYVENEYPQQRVWHDRSRSRGYI